MRLFLVLILGILTYPCSSQYKVHSHNDYEQEVPFWTAFSAGANSIEVDLCLKDGELYAAHEVDEIVEGRTFESLYLRPLSHAFSLNLRKGDSILLLIDVKTAAYETLDRVVKVLDGYRHLLEASAPLRVIPVISGNRPAIETYSSYPDYLYFDYQTLTDWDQVPWQKVAMVSMSFKQFSSWNGKGKVVKNEADQLRKAISRVHQQHKPIRFWATPDTKSAWFALSQMGVDWINTDQPFEAVNYLSGLDRNIYAVAHGHPVYKPTFHSDGSSHLATNVVLIIGDGMGLAQISAGMYAGGNQLTLTQLRHIGFSKTQSADDFTTDSAAGGTAMATGSKTNNRSIGVTPSGAIVPNLPEILDAKGFVSGIITTDELTGATPSAFYAHQKDRGMELPIATDILSSPVSLFMGAGQQKFVEAAVLDPLIKEGFEQVRSVDGIMKTTSQKVIYFSGNKGMPSVVEGRGDFLPKALDASVKFLSRKENPFFLMVEGAYIDTGGHWNRLDVVTEEVLDLDLAIAQALKFADDDGETLVIVTADHETAGLSLPQGSLRDNQLEGQFYSTDHTGMMVPVFAYGPQSQLFRGVYENTAIFEKILEAIGEHPSN